MDYKFDWTITLGNVITLVILMFGSGAFYTRIVKFISKLEYLIGEFPPHKHINRKILYPKGLAPQEPHDTEIS